MNINNFSNALFMKVVEQTCLESSKKKIQMDRSNNDEIVNTLHKLFTHGSLKCSSRCFEVLKRILSSFCCELEKDCRCLCNLNGLFFVLA